MPDPGTCILGRPFLPPRCVSSVRPRRRVVHHAGLDGNIAAYVCLCLYAITVCRLLLPSDPSARGCAAGAVPPVQWGLSPALGLCRAAGAVGRGRGTVGGRTRQAGCTGVGVGTPRQSAGGAGGGWCQTGGGAHGRFCGKGFGVVRPHRSYPSIRTL